MGPHFSIGMRRLAIIDVAGGDQPLVHDDGNLALVFNGEIYNHAELRRELEAQGSPLRHRPLRHRGDPPRLRGVGRRVVDHLVGMFAFAISDQRARRAVPRTRPPRHQAAVLRRRRPGGFVFALGAQGAFQDDRVPYASPILDVVRRFLLFRVHDDGEDDVLRRRAATPSRAHDAGAVADGIAKVERYWNPDGEPRVRVRPQRRRRTREEFAARFDRVVARHLISDVPVGVPLSAARLERRRRDDGPLDGRDGTDLHTDGLYSFSRALPGPEHRRERVHPRGGA